MFTTFLLLYINVSYTQLIFQDVECYNSKNCLRDTCGLPQAAYASI